MSGLDSHLGSMPYSFGPGFEYRKRHFTFFLSGPFSDFFQALFPSEGRFPRDSRGFTRHVFQAIVIILKALESGQNARKIIP